MNNKYLSMLESRVDHLETELNHLQNLLIRCGFSEGIKTLKESAKELIEEMQFEQNPHPTW